MRSRKNNPSVRPIEQLCPGVTHTGDRLVYRVQSLTNPNTFYLCDMEGRDGNGDCNCPRFTISTKYAGKTCKHLWKVRHYQSLEWNQTVIKAHEKTPPPHRPRL